MGLFGGTSSRALQCIGSVDHFAPVLEAHKQRVMTFFQTIFLWQFSRTGRSGPESEYQPPRELLEQCARSSTLIFSVTKNFECRRRLSPARRPRRNRLGGTPLPFFIRASEGMPTTNKSSRVHFYKKVMSADPFCRATALCDHHKDDINHWMEEVRDGRHYEIRRNDETRLWKAEQMAALPPGSLIPILLGFMLRSAESACRRVIEYNAEGGAELLRHGLVPSP